MKPTFEEIRELRQHWEATLSAGEYRLRMESQIDALAVGDPGRAELLSTLSEEHAAHPEGPEDLARAETYARAAIGDGGPTTIDPRVDLLRALGRQDGREEEVTELVRDSLRDHRGGRHAVGLLPSMGETLEELGRLREALRAYTVGLREFELGDEPDFDQMMCLTGRYRVRRALDRGRDKLDKAGERLIPQLERSLAEKRRQVRESGGD